MSSKAVQVLVASLVVMAAFAGFAGINATQGVSAQGASCGYPLTIVDATGEEVTVKEEPQRIVTLAPSAAQTVWEIGGKEKVVGVSQYASYLEGAGEKTNISGNDPGFINLERIVELNPDLVLAPNVIPPGAVEKLRELNITVYKFRYASSIEDIYQKTYRTGRLIGECEGAEKTVEWMKEEISVVRKAVKGEEKPRVLYVFFGYTAGKNTFINEIIETAGGRNIASQANITGFRPISDEVVIERNPEWIILNSDSPRVPKSPAYNATFAVIENNTVVLNSNYISQPGPRVVYPIVELAKALHPEAYAKANQSIRGGQEGNKSNESGSDEGEQQGEDGNQGDGQDGDTGESEGNDGASDGEGTGEDQDQTDTEQNQEQEGTALPGFGVAVALIALILAGIGARRL